MLFLKSAHYSFHSKRGVVQFSMTISGEESLLQYIELSLSRVWVGVYSLSCIIMSFRKQKNLRGAGFF